MNSDKTRKIKGRRSGSDIQARSSETAKKRERRLARPREKYRAHRSSRK